MQVWHPFTQHGLEEEIPTVARGEGAILYTADGRRVIDAISSWWVTTHGHCHPRIMAAIREQSEKLDQMIFAGWTHEPAQKLAEGMAEIMPDALCHIFYSDSGSTAVEVALKMALGHWHNRGEQRDRIVVMDHSYHGDTIGAMSVGARGVFNRAYAPMLFDVTAIPFPASGAEEACLDALRRACADGRTAAFIVEPLLLGAGGMKMYPPETLRAMHAICREAGVLFIADEVMTGWGRTGTLLACEQAGIVPDLLCLAKGITGGAVPLAATLASEEIYASHYSRDRSRMFFHSSSYTANPLACAAALANLAVWKEEPVQARIDAITKSHAAFADDLRACGNIENVRQTGTVLACEFAESEGDYLSDLAPRLAAFFREANILLRPLGNSVYIMPPYGIGEDDLGRVYQSILDAARRFA